MGPKRHNLPVLVLALAAVAWAAGHPGIASTGVVSPRAAPTTLTPGTPAPLILANGTLRLETAACPLDADPAPGHQVAVELWMRDLDGLATGFQAFLEFDPGTITYRGDLSSYTFTPFPMHVQDILTAQVSTGKIRVDGSDDFNGAGTDQDSLLATLVFDIAPQCAYGAVDFDLTQLFDSELSFEGDPLATTLVNTGDFRFDVTGPNLGPCPNITVPADPGIGDGCTGAAVTFEPPFLPAVEDNCTGPVNITCDPPSGTVFMTGAPTPVTCTASDECGNESVCTFNVTVSPMNLIDVVVELPGSLPTSRCIHFRTDDCGTFKNVVLNFIDHDADAATPVRATATISIGCGNWTTLCAKDQQHTLWDSSPLSIVDGRFIADDVLSLLPGDGNNDGRVTMVDVTALLLYFGGPEPLSGCPWTGVRGADFNNNGNVGSEDFSLLSANWLSMTSCSCADSALGSSPGPSGTSILPETSVDPGVPRR